MNIKRILLTGGRAPSTLHFARILANNGYELYVADSLTDYLCKASNVFKKAFVITKPNSQYQQFIEDLLKIIQQEKIDLLIPTCEEVFHISRSKRQLSAYCHVFCGDIDLLHQLHNKWEFVELIHQIPKSPIKAPTSYYIKTKEDFDYYNCMLTGHYVLKPAYSRFSTDVQFIELGKHQQELQINYSEGWVLQEKVEGTQICSYSIAQQGQLTIHSAYETNYRVGIGATVYFQYFESEKIVEFVKQVISQSRFTGQIAFDFIRTSNGELYVIECNPRLTSGIHLFKESEPFSFLDHSATQFPPVNHNRMVALAMLPQLVNEKGWRAFREADDVMFCRNDLKPFFYQFYVFTMILLKSAMKKKNMLKITTEDIEWSGGTEWRRVS